MHVSGEVRAPLIGTGADKRNELIGEPLSSPGCGERLARCRHKLVVKREPENNGPLQTRDVFVRWLTRQFNRNRDWDQSFAPR